ncbi:MAG: ATP-dependent helicase HrpB [Pseudomonadota bacterium]
MTPDLPIHEVLPELREALLNQGAAVLIAPPGAGKTTAVAPDLLGQAWCKGQIILTSPRRVAARAAAEHMAEVLGEKPGHTIGFVTRLESKVSRHTRIVVMTEAILLNKLVEDPELKGVSAVFFDEAHERHLDSDLGLALTLETRDLLRDDLRVLVMSATIDGIRFAKLLGENSPVIESKGRSFTLEIKWLGSDPVQRIEDQVASGVMAACAKEEGDILAFLPGVAEIERTRERLEAKLPDVPILPLHGQIEPPDQRIAIKRDPSGRRRIVLATAIAETSLTLDGVSVVVDSGLTRLAQYDRTSGTMHLVTRRASQAAADQRAGRAARQAPGVAYRLWEQGGHLGRPKFAPPEIDTSDLAGLMLKLARRGVCDPSELQWLDPPPPASIAAARAQLDALGAIDPAGRLTDLGERISVMPMAPDQAAALLYGARAGCVEDVARLVMLLQERGLGGRGEDLAQRLTQWNGDRSKRASRAARTVNGWCTRASQLIEDWDALELEPAECLALARPDFVARRRNRNGEHWLSVGGRGFQLDPASLLARAEWIVIGDAQGRAKAARITAGLELEASQVEVIFAESIQESTIARWNPEKKRVETRRERRLGAILLSGGPDPNPEPQAIVDTLVEKALNDLVAIFPAGFFTRAQFAGLKVLGPENLKADAAIWLAPLLVGRRDLEIPSGRFAEAALGLLDWKARQTFDKSAPTQFISPAGTNHKIDYAGDDAPCVEVRVQALFGLDQQPMIGDTPLLLKLTSPAGRPIQSTRDLPGFWRGSWADVAKDMKGRYPKHRWPEEPWKEVASLRTKNAFNHR